MARQYDPQSGKIVDAGLSDGPLVPLLAPGGEPRAVPAAQLSFFLDSGYTPDTPEARLELQQQAEFGEGLGNEVAAAGLGAARALSFGLTDLVLAKSGLVKATTLEQLKTRNPNATLAGELGALLFPVAGQAMTALGAAKAGRAAIPALGGVVGVGENAFLLGATAPVAEVAGTAGSPVLRGLGAALSGAGRGVAGVSELATRIGAEAAKATGSRVLGSAAQAAAESFAYNVAKNLSETVLGDKDVTAERLLANSGQALAIGAGLGIGVPLAGKAVKLAADKARQALDGFGGYLKNSVLPTVSDAAAAGYSKAFAAVSGGGKEAEDQVFALVSGGFRPATGKPAEREAFIKAISPERFDEILRTTTEQLDDVYRSVTSTVRKGFKDIRPQEVANLLDNVELGPGLEDFGRLINGVRDAAKKMADEPLLYDQAYRRQLEKIAEQLEQRAGSTAGGGKVGFSSAKELWNALNDIKGSALNDLAYEVNTKAVGRAEMNAIMEARGVYRSFKEHLENPALYGDAGARQAAFNEKFTAFQRLVEKKNGRLGDFKRFFLGPSDRVDTAKVLRVLRKIGSGRDVEEIKALEDFMAVSRSLVDEIETSSLNAGVGGIDRAGFESLVSKLADTQKKAADDLAAVSKIRSQDAFGMALLNFQKSVGDTLFRDGVFSATVKLAQKAASPFGVASALSTAEGLVLKTSGRVRDAVGGFIDRAASTSAKGLKAARPFAEPASVKILLDGIVGDTEGEKPKGRRGGYNETLKRLGDMMADPMKTAAKLGEGMQGIQGAAPQLTQATVELQLRGLQYIYEKAPKNEFAQETLNPFIQDWQPPDYELASWERTVAAVQDPIGVVEDLATGDVSPEAVEALAAVYPSLYEDIRTQLIERVSEMQESMPYHDRIQLSLLFGVNLDPSLDSAFASAVQNGYAQAAQQASKSSSAYRPSSAASKLGALEETPAQRISRR